MRFSPAAACDMKSSSETALLRRAAALGFAVEAFAALRDLARLRGVVDDEELVAGHGHAGRGRGPAPEWPGRPA